jgi:hypothetical protein
MRATTMPESGPEERKQSCYLRHEADPESYSQSSLISPCSLSPSSHSDISVRSLASSIYTDGEHLITKSAAATRSSHVRLLVLLALCL